MISLQEAKSVVLNYYDSLDSAQSDDELKLCFEIGFSIISKPKNFKFLKIWGKNIAIDINMFCHTMILIRH